MKFVASVVVLVAKLAIGQKGEKDERAILSDTRALDAVRLISIMSIRT